MVIQKVGSPMKRSKNLNPNQRRSSQQADREATGRVCLGESNIRISVDRNGRELIATNWALTTTPIQVHPARKIPTILAHLTRDADVELSSVHIALPRDTNGQTTNGFLNDSQQRTLMRELADKFRVRVTVEDARPANATPGDLPGTEAPPDQIIEMGLDDQGIYVPAGSQAPALAHAVGGRRCEKLSGPFYLRTAQTTTK
jgi:hypothetical protein